MNQVYRRIPHMKQCNHSGKQKFSTEMTTPKDVVGRSVENEELSSEVIDIQWNKN